VPCLRERGAANPASATETDECTIGFNEKANYACALPGASRPPPGRSLRRFSDKGMEMAKAAAGDEKFALTASRHFVPWLAETGGGLAFTTYQAGKLFLIGVRPEGRLSVFERTFARAMGLAASEDGRGLALATQYQIHRGRSPRAPPRRAAALP
jgi:hypothetical protein